MAYIDREAFKRKLVNEKSFYPAIVARALEEMPIADVVEVKHGEWRNNIQKFTSPAGVTKDFLAGYKCSACGRTEIKKEPYCNCGAKMDGGKKE